VLADVTRLEADPRLGIQPFLAAAKSILAQLEASALPAFRQSTPMAELEHVLRVEREEYPAQYDPADPESKLDSWGGSTVARTIMHAMRRHGEADFLGVHADADPGAPYVATSYAEGLAAAEAFGSALLSLFGDLPPPGATDTRPCVTICANNRPEWCIADLGCFFKGVVTAPIARVLDVDTAAFVLDHAEAQVVVCSGETLPLILQLLPRCPRVQAVVVMDMYGFALSFCRFQRALIRCVDVQVQDDERYCTAARAADGLGSARAVVYGHG
jgi:hypothetical protein